MAEAAVSFRRIGVLEVRQWVEANPDLVNAKDIDGMTPLYSCTYHYDFHPLAKWLLDREADVNGKTAEGRAYIHTPHSRHVFNVLLDYNADCWTERNGPLSCILQRELLMSSSTVWYACCKTRASKLLSTPKSSLDAQRSITPAVRQKVCPRPVVSSKLGSIRPLKINAD